MPACSSCLAAAAPRFAVSVIVEHGGSGSTAAAPIARDVLLEVQRRNSLAPTAALPVEEKEAAL